LDLLATFWFTTFAILYRTTSNLVERFFIIKYNYVSGFEKRGNFVQNAKFWHFSSYHHFKAVRASDFILGLWPHQAFYLTNPMFEAVDSLLSEVVAAKPEV